MNHNITYIYHIITLVSHGLVIHKLFGLLLDDNHWDTCAQETSSVSTFKSCASTIRVLRPQWFLLENVDLEGDDSEGNLQSIIRVLEAAEYLVQTFRLVASDFGLPQRRVRIYLVGFCKQRRPDISFQRMERHISMMRLKCQLPGACLT